jgi:hypothetical protein
VQTKSPGSLMFLMQLWIVFGIVSKAAHKSQHAEAVPCDTCKSQHVEVVPCDGVGNVHKSQHTKAVPCDAVCKVHFAQLSLALSSPVQNRLIIFCYRQPFSKLVASSGRT